MKKMELDAKTVERFSNVNENWDVFVPLSNLSGFPDDILQ